MTSVLSVSPTGKCVVCSTNRTPLEKCDHGTVTVLGEGTYGLVYLCQRPRRRTMNTTSERSDTPTDSSEAVESFVEKILKLDASVTHIREVQCLEACRHPNVVRLLSTSNAVSNRVTVRMEYCDGGDLFSYIRNRRKAGLPYFTSEEVLRLLTQLLLAVHYLHTKGVLHRDIKTRNIFLSAVPSDQQEGPSAVRLKLGDFGCSVQSDLSIAEDQHRTLCGTYASFSPEMLQVDQDQRAQYGKKAETWSVGVVLYEMLSLGTPPFSWDAERADSFYRMTQRILAGSYPPLPSTATASPPPPPSTTDEQPASSSPPPSTPPQYKPELVQLCHSMLTVDPEKRPSVRSLLSHPLIAAECQQLVVLTAAASPQEGAILQRQLDSLTEPVSFVYRGTCLRVRSSTAEVVPAEIRIASTAAVQFRDVNSQTGKPAKDWSTANLLDCLLLPDEFEESDGRMFYGVCLRPKKLTAVTFGFYDKTARDALEAQFKEVKKNQK